MKLLQGAILMLTAAFVVRADHFKLTKRSISLLKRQCPSGEVEVCVGYCGPSGYKCCGGGSGAPPQGVCCEDFSYVLPPDQCLSGAQEPEPVSSPASTITPPPAPPSIIEGSTSTTAYAYYYSTWYYTYSWTYFYYYYTYFAEYYSTATYSYETTLYTTLSFTGTDEAAASSSFVDYTATLSLPTPTQTVTPFSESPGPTGPMATPTANGTVTSSPPPAQFTGGAAPSTGHVGILIGSSLLTMVAAAAVLL